MSTITLTPRTIGQELLGSDLEIQDTALQNDLTAATSTSTQSEPRVTPAHLSRAMDNIFRRNEICRPERRAVVEISYSVARAVFEIVAGYRSVSQLAFVVEPQCIDKLRRRALLETSRYTVDPVPGTAHGHIMSLHLDRCLSGAWECTAIIGFKDRVRAVALKIEPWHGRWQVTDVELI
ncbi:Rv3235 family protein [Glutamicibacter sp. JC586]|uniref:Rv3235 family protein n=1 Tax=Glutamicibacter sp. JC586 TaxID=2590552 RepID=UPI001357D87E|nr:Rv3235 family protein [Glutamicibacter sp. JC586]